MALRAAEVLQAAELGAAANLGFNRARAGAERREVLEANVVALIGGGVELQAACGHFQPPVGEIAFRVFLRHLVYILEGRLISGVQKPNLLKLGELIQNKEVLVRIGPNDEFL